MLHECQSQRGFSPHLSVHILNKPVSDFTLPGREYQEEGTRKEMQWKTEERERNPHR